MDSDPKLKSTASTSCRDPPGKSRVVINLCLDPKMMFDLSMHTQNIEKLRGICMRTSHDYYLVQCGRTLK